MDLAELLKYAVEYGASDLHITTGRPPMVRIAGRLIPSGYETELGPDDTRTLIYSVLTDDQKAKFEEDHELDFSIGIPGVSRFRVNVFMQRGSVAGVFGAIGENLPTVDDLGTEAAYQACGRLGFETPALVLMPISVDRDTLGLIVLGGRQAGQFDLNDLNLALGVARQAGQAILNARHREEEAARARHGRQYVRF